jgi:hypothetical protein
VQIYCNVIYAWGNDLVGEGVANPQAIMTDDDLNAWQAGMFRYPWAGSVD